MAIEDDTTGDVVHRRRLRCKRVAKDFRSRLERVSGEIRGRGKDFWAEWVI